MDVFWSWYLSPVSFCDFGGNGGMIFSRDVGGIYRIALVCDCRLVTPEAFQSVQLPAAKLLGDLSITKSWPVIGSNGGYHGFSGGSCIIVPGSTVNILSWRDSSISVDGCRVGKKRRATTGYFREESA